ncbi:hypothetical protein CO653_12985 [Rhizobium anhuiense]|uniref:hypothetical protein n=1 Tax=Rhizobium anhuiense TaxID=1184720 RepID=UPI000BEA23ED|nr:hypothetical protein [Rhizobium anhuiense]PDS65106.1 hypothetical protein CO653_12985 [Rhizobium anhuiense]
MSWYDAFASNEAIIGVTGALLGSAVGGIATFCADFALGKNDRKHALQELAIMTVSKATLIRSDALSLANIINLGVQRNETRIESPRLWQMVSNIYFTPAFSNLELSDLSFLVRLKHRDALEKSLDLFSRYKSMLDHVEAYNSLRSDYGILMKGNSYMRDGTFYYRSGEDPEQKVLEEQMEHFIQAIRAQADNIAMEAQAVQQLIFDACRKHFGTADFLRLS